MHAPHLLLPVGGLSSHSTWPEEALWLIQSWPYYHFKIVSTKIHQVDYIYATLNQSSSHRQCCMVNSSKVYTLCYTHWWPLLLPLGRHNLIYLLYYVYLIIISAYAAIIT